MSIVTIRGELGSGAPEIGKLVADKLHTDYVDREIIAQIAEQVHLPKQDIATKEMPPGTLLGRIMEALGHSGYYEAAYLPTWQISLDDTRYLAGLESVIKELAGSGSCVIRGRGSQFILRDFPDAFHVLVVAPLELRIKRVMEDLRLDEEAAKKEVEHFDSSRREFTKRYFHAELEDPLNYDLVVNTHRLIFEDAASIIVNICSQYFPFERQP
ncbi:MAG: cytidylate kinase-like family protein [Chloroflexota bacterium]|nr:MAG: cytidylate kinase-like family protein [Chloroflexota bacterium]